MQDRHTHGTGGPKPAVVMILVAVAAVAGLAVLVDDASRILTYLPWLLLAACPLMHIFMHRGHVHRHGADGEQPTHGGTVDTTVPHRPAGGQS